MWSGLRLALRYGYRDMNLESSWCPFSKIITVGSTLGPKSLPKMDAWWDLQYQACGSSCGASLKSCFLKKRWVTHKAFGPLLHPGAWLAKPVISVPHGGHSWVDYFFLPQPTPLPLVPWTLASKGEEPSWSVSTWFLHAPWRKCVVSLAIESYHKVLLL